MMNACVTGFLVGLSLILAIGSQNAFVLRQGLRGEHVGFICLTCALSDAILMLLGVTGLKNIITRIPLLKPVMIYMGAAFLFWYGVKSMRSAFASNDTLLPSNTAAAGLGKTIGICLAITWLNPHVYLDTVFLIGSISTRFPGNELLFALGASTASTLFFFSLGYGAAVLRPVFEKPIAWRMLDGSIAITMWGLAANLMAGN